MMVRGALCLSTGLLGVLVHAQLPPPAPAARPEDPVRQFQPGVQIDWQQPAVIVAAHVVLREGPLEFFACFAGKEHESVLRLDATAGHIYMALGLIGVTPGRPPVWNEELRRYARPTGGLVDVDVRWRAGDELREASSFTWVREIDALRSPIPRPWVFSGSLPGPEGGLSADRTGVGVAVVDFPDSLITLSGGYSSDFGALWLEANTAEIPPEGTQVQLILRPARLREYSAVLDFRGTLVVNGRQSFPAELADIIRLARQLDPTYQQEISAVGALRTDQARLAAALLGAELPVTAWTFTHSGQGPP